MKGLAHWALLRLLIMVWLRASNKILYVGSCIMYTVNEMVSYEKASGGKTMKNGLLYVLIMMII